MAQARPAVKKAGEAHVAESLDPEQHDDAPQADENIQHIEPDDVQKLRQAVCDAIDGKSNRSIWDTLKRTDPRATKPFQRAGGFRGTQIDPAWRLQMMTEVFGPVGRGWGYEQLEWTIAERMIFICCRVWYSDPRNQSDKYYTGPQWGGTELVRKNRDSTERPDDEAFKMSMTDAVGKCMLQIGLSADIYLGQFDDSKYREESEVFYTVKANPDLHPDAIVKFAAQVREKLAGIHDRKALQAYWEDGINERIRLIGTVNKIVPKNLLADFRAAGERIDQKEKEAVEATAKAKLQQADHPKGLIHDPDDGPPPPAIARPDPLPDSPSGGEVDEFVNWVKTTLPHIEDTASIEEAYKREWKREFNIIKSAFSDSYKELLSMVQERKHQINPNGQSKVPAQTTRRQS